MCFIHITERRKSFKIIWFDIIVFDIFDFKEIYCVLKITQYVIYNIVDLPQKYPVGHPCLLN